MHNLGYVMFTKVKLWCWLMLLYTQNCTDCHCLLRIVVPTSVAKHALPDKQCFWQFQTVPLTAINCGGIIKLTHPSKEF